MVVICTYDEVSAVNSLGRNGTSEDGGNSSETHFDGSGFVRWVKRVKGAC